MNQIKRELKVDHRMLRQLTREQLTALQPGEVRYVRLWRAYHPTPLLIFEGEMPLYVDRREHRGVLQRVEVCPPGECNWAEYTVYGGPGVGSWSDSDERGNCIVEDWCMEIYGGDGAGEPYDARAVEGQTDYLRWDRESLRELGHHGMLGDYTQLHPRARYDRGRLVIG